MKKIGVGIIGGGFIGRIHAEALRRLGYVEVVAIAEANRDLAEAKARELSIPKAYGDYRDVLRDKDVDSVHILTPNTLHYRMSKESLEAGKHVVCEKPLAMSSGESADLLKTARRSGLVHAICHNKRYYPLVKQAREMVRAGEVGDIRLIHGHYLQDWLFLDTDYNWRVEASLGGSSRAVADIGTHWFDMVQHVSGQKVKSVFADITTFIPVRKKPKKAVETYEVHELKPGTFDDVEIDTEDHGSVLIRFSGGAKGVLVACQVCAGRKNFIHFEINGTKRSLEWNGEQPNHMWIGERGRCNGELIKDASLMAPEAGKYAGVVVGGLGEGYQDTFKAIFGDIYGWLRERKRMDEGDAPFPTFETGHQELSVVDAVFESVRQGTWADVRE